jgi:NAD-dependent SIR2 family protein deacetylase
METSLQLSVLKGAVRRSMTCNVMIFYAKNNQAAIVDINPENTPFNYEMDFSIRQTAVEGLSRLISIFESPF